MKTLKKIIVLLVVSILVLAMVGCSKNQTGVSDGQKGKYMFIRMKTNPTTGFDFKCEVMENSVGQVFLEEAVLEASNNNGLVGAPSYRTYIFSAESGTKGDATIDFHYLRDWKGGEDGYHIYYDVYVDKDGNMSYKGKRIEKVSIEPNVEEIEDPTFADEYDISSTQYEEEPEN